MSENEPLVGKDELMREDDKEDEIREDKEFCMLCAKYRDKKDFVNVGVGPVMFFICKKCNVVVFNLNLILTRTKEKIKKQLDEAAKKEKKIVESVNSGLIIPKGRIIS